MPPARTPTLALALALTASCGVVADDTYHGEVLATLRGRVTFMPETGTISAVAIAWPQEGRLTTAESAATTAVFPAAFELAIYQPPFRFPDEVGTSFAEIVVAEEDLLGQPFITSDDYQACASHHRLFYLDRTFDPDELQFPAGEPLVAGFHVMEMTPEGQLRVAPGDLDAEIVVDARTCAPML